MGKSSAFFCNTYQKDYDSSRHYYSENNVNHCHGFVSAGYKIKGGESSHENEGVGVCDIKVGLKKIRKAYEDGGGVGYKKDEYTNC